MVMNALAIDPKRAWKGPWRWFSEEMLDCCTPLEIVQKSGITLPEFICLARCNGANCDANYASSSSIEEFREAVKHCTSQDQQFMVVSYNRQRLGQTGTGHFSPIAGYHPDRDLVLVMDVARFKYPPHWVKLEQLFEALKDLDPVTGLSRGYVLISNGSGPHVFSRIKAGPDLWQDMVRHFFEKIPNLLQKKLIEKGDLSLDEYVAILSNYVTTSTNVTTNFSTYTKDLKERISSEHEALLETLHAEIHSTQLFVLLREFALGSSSLPLKLSSKEKDGSQSVEAKSCCQRALALDSAFLELMTIILYLALSVLEAQEWWKERGLPQALADELASLQRLPSVKNEVDYLRSNLSNFTSFVASGK
jgi:glutathione gamma-glutamylcysteinyltransferase